MNDPFDPLEAELAALRPHEISPALQRRIAERLVNSSTSRSRWPLRLAMAGSLAAACLAVAVLWPRGNNPEPVAELSQDVPQPLIASAFDDTLPSFWSYHTALVQSPEALDALLDKHAVSTPKSSLERAPVFVFARFNSELDAFSGEL